MTKGEEVMASIGIDLSRLKKKNGKYFYRGHWWKPNQPQKSSNLDKKMMVLATKTIGGKRKGKIIHFGAKGYGHNYSKSAKKNYLRRSAGIRNKKGTLTKNDKWSANYWARRILWPKNKPTTGPRITIKKRKAA